MLPDVGHLNLLACVEFSEDFPNLRVRSDDYPAKSLVMFSGIYVNALAFQGRTAHSACVAMPIEMNGLEDGIVIIVRTSCPQYPMFP
jgi:hypothetical protein